MTETHNTNKQTLPSKATLLRLPDYYFYVKELIKDHKEYISSTKIAKALKLNSIQVRKDLALISRTQGKPHKGFKIDNIIKDIESYLGYNNVNNAVLVGVGQLGKALLSYEGFKNYGLHIVAGFDINEDLTGLKIYGRNIYAFEEMETIVQRLGIIIGIITVPKDSAQEVCNRLVGAGIKAIWNFAPIHLNLPDDILLKNENMAASFAVLSRKLQKSLR